jgi:hypothetical protein
MNLPRSLGCFLAAGLMLSGCVPIPCIEKGSFAMRGRVIDSVTKLPVQNATVSLNEHPTTKGRTDRNGQYRVPATHYLNILLAGGICGSEIPFGRNYAGVLDVSHPLYQTNRVRAMDYRNPGATNSAAIMLRDILLDPRKE